MTKATKYMTLSGDLPEDRELAKLNHFLDRLEQLEKDLKGIIIDVDRQRLERENVLRIGTCPDMESLHG